MSTAVILGFSRLSLSLSGFSTILPNKKMYTSAGFKLILSEQKVSTPTTWQPPPRPILGLLTISEYGHTAWRLRLLLSLLIISGQRPQMLSFSSHSTLHKIWIFYGIKASQSLFINSIVFLHLPGRASAWTNLHKRFWTTVSHRDPRPNNLSLSHNFVATMYEWRHDYFSKSLVLKWLLSAMRMMRIWQRLWLSWQSIRFRHQRLTVRIQSSAKLYIEHLLTVNCIEQTKIKKMRPGVALL